MSKRMPAIPLQQLSEALTDIGLPARFAHIRS